jgi:uroporphyrinogen-III synthase
MSNIWLTRPLHQADALFTELSREHKVLHLPMLEIEALVWDEKIKASILNFDQYDMAIFISSNAAKLGMECITNYWPQYPSHIKNFALGPTSAAVLQSYDLEVSFPTESMSSEALLEQTELTENQIGGRRVLIFRGEGGREALAEGLKEKGALVDYLALYRRNLPQYSSSYLQECIENFQPAGVVISSGEALENFITLFEALWPTLFNIPLFVSSQRIKGLAESLGFEKIIAMPGANDEAIINTLGNCLK